MNRRVVLVAAAVMLALLGTFAVYSYGKSADQRAVAGAKPTTVLVAIKRVDAGTTWAEAVKKGYLRAEKMPATSAPSTAIASTTEAAIGADAVAETDIAPGQIVLREAFGTQIAKTGALTIPKGLIAVSVQLTLPADVAGYVVPGSQVIIFVSGKLDTKNPKLKLSNGDALTLTKTLLPRVNVLATSSAPTKALAGTNSTAGGGSSDLILTLAVTQLDAERLINQQTVGALYLGLLSASSKVSADDPGVVNAGVFKPVPVFVK